MIICRTTAKEKSRRTADKGGLSTWIYTYSNRRLYARAYLGSPLGRGGRAQRGRRGQPMTIPIIQKDCKALSVTCGDSSPKGRAKGAVHRCVAALLPQPFLHHYFILLGFARIESKGEQPHDQSHQLHQPQSDVVILQPPSILA